MKKSIIYILTFIATSSIITACKKDFLSAPPVSVVDAKAIFGNQLQTSGFLANIYSTLTGGPDYFGGGTGLTTMCDEAEAGYAYVGTNAINVASFNASNNPDNASLNNSYIRIRKCNIMLANKDLMTFDPKLKDQYLAEARFLRAFFYSELLKRFGGMPIITSPIDYEVEEGTPQNVAHSAGHLFYPLCRCCAYEGHAALLSVSDCRFISAVLRWLYDK